MSVEGSIITDLRHLAEMPVPQSFWGDGAPKGWYLGDVNLYLDMLKGMKRMAGKNAGREYENSRDISFAEIVIPDGKRAEAKKVVGDITADLERVLDAYLTEGYKFSIKYDHNNRCYQCSMTCDAVRHPNKGKCLISRSDSWLEAIGLCIYKTQVLAPNGVWPERSERSNWG